MFGNGDAVIASMVRSCDFSRVDGGGRGGLTRNDVGGPF